MIMNSIMKKATCQTWGSKTPSENSVSKTEELPLPLALAQATEEFEPLPPLPLPELLIAADCSLPCGHAAWPCCLRLRFRPFGNRAKGFVKPPETREVMGCTKRQHVIPLGV